MLTVHHLGISQSERIVWLCEELGLEYELKRYDRRADNRLAPDEYKALHPMGIAPVIADGNLVLGESGAICDYICARYGNDQLVPSVDSPDFADHLFWFHWSNGTFMTILMMQLVRGDVDASDPRSAFVDARNSAAWSMIETRLGEAPFFGGANLTTADIMMVYCLTTSRAFRGTSIDAYPNVKAYLQRIGARPAYQAAMAKAEPGMQPMLA
ncbi:MULTISPECIES: glutathione S-transferase [unclassified Sphingopyxis]|uniref:glutathione S-transferase family protein n=1 Tax=unclassified Sphingopyxis TaxID=2614943 RepID=UPI002865E9FD|nr:MULTISPECIES: glutathione S-transferase [unclassified Sphingopyxis]MDR7060590.1 glutathione S-transferase [Sphingopyxis sp. BE235]MDR7179897.1 glutathione S-transferase [Sphingopyxis sp. BE249]